MMFSFWSQSAGSGRDKKPTPSESAKEWQAFFPDFQVFDDEDVLGLLEARSPDLAEMYKRITLPACRSDVARLALLHAHGGMYIDAHAHPGDMAAMANIFALLSRYELIVCDQVLDWAHENDLQIANGAIWCRRGSQVVDTILNHVLDNLMRQMRAEDKASGYVPYNIAILSGSWAIVETVWNVPPHTRQRPFPRRENLKEKVYVYPYIYNLENTPFHFYRHYGYREPGQHWSERQKTQRLFFDLRSAD